MTGICLQNQKLVQKICDRGLGCKDRGDLSYLRIHPVNLRGEVTYSTTPLGLSPLATSSTGCNTWIAPTDKGSVVEESEAEEDEDVDKDEDEEGRIGRGEQGAEEEEEEEVV